MQKDVLIAKLKCENVSLLANSKMAEDYMIDTSCGEEDNVDDKNTLKENALLIDLLSNESLLNHKDEYNRDVIGCDFSKIKKLSGVK